MKFNILPVTAALLLTAPAMVLAASAPYPFIAPKCNHTLRLPTNLAGVYFSEDCSTAFIMPDKYGKLSIDSVSDLPNLDLCTGLNQANATSNKIQVQIDDIANKMATLPIDSKTRDTAVDEIGKLQALQAKLLTSYEDIVGGYAQVTLAVSSFEQRKNDFLLMNQDTIINNKINLLEMPISESYISFQSKPYSGPARMKAVLSHSLPGINQPDNDGNSEVQHVHMNGSISGQLVLSLSGLCGKRRPNWQPSDLAADLVTNMTYTVPVMSIAGYTASLNVKEAVNTFLTSIQTKSQFSVHEMADLMAKGESGVVYNWTLENYEMPGIYSDADKAGFFKSLREDAFNRLTQRFLEQLKVAGFLQLEQPVKTAEAPAPGFIDEIHSGSSCSSNWFTSSCSDYSYVVKIPASSSADSLVKKLADLKFTDVEHIEVHQIISRIYTAAFVSNPPTQVNQ